MYRHITQGRVIALPFTQSGTKQNSQMILEPMF